MIAAVVIDYKAPTLTQLCIDSLPSYVKVVRIDNSEQNVGFAAGCNRGIRQALAEGADAVLLLNNDAIVYRDTVSKMVGCLAPGVGAVGCVILKPDHSVQVWGGGVVKLGRSIMHTEYSPQVDWLSGCCMLVSREALLATDGFDEKFFLYWEDVDLSFRIRQAGLRLVVAPDAFVTHLGGSNPPRHSAGSLIRFFRKHYKLWLLHVGVAAVLRLVRHRHQRAGHDNSMARGACG